MKLPILTNTSPKAQIQIMIKITNRNLISSTFLSIINPSSSYNTSIQFHFLDVFPGRRFRLLFRRFTFSGLVILRSVVYAVCFRNYTYVQLFRIRRSNIYVFFILLIFLIYYLWPFFIIIIIILMNFLVLTLFIVSYACRYFFWRVNSFGRTWTSSLRNFKDLLDKTWK